MKKFVIASVAAIFCFCHLNAQDRFILYGKVLGADGTPVPSAQISFSTVIGRQPMGATQVGPDGSFKLVLQGPELAMVKFAAPLYDSLTLPFLLTTIQHTMSVTVHLNGHGLADSASVHVKPPVSIQIKDENTELGIAERLMIAIMDEHRLDAEGYMLTPGYLPQHRDPDSLLSYLSMRIQEENNPMHRELLLLRYRQVCTNAKRNGNPSILKTVLHLVEPDSPFWSIAPELLKASAETPAEYTSYLQRVKSRTADPELKIWIDQSR